MTYTTSHDTLPLQAHGYATNEFEVTVERLGAYLPVWIFSIVASNDYSSLINSGRTH
jgi:Heterokaryon incompatibility protein Het-C